MAAQATFQKIEDVQPYGQVLRESVNIITDGAGASIEIGAAGSGKTYSLTLITLIARVLTNLPYVLAADQKSFTVMGLALNSTITIEVEAELVGV